MNTRIPFALLSSLIISAPCAASVTMLQTKNEGLKTYLDRFLTISCDKSGKKCIAEGFGKEPKINDRLIYTTQDAGVTWSRPSTLLSPEPITPEDASITVNPADISCDAYGQQCVMVSASMINGVPTPVVYHTQDSGQSWSEPSVLPLPKSIDQKQHFFYPAGIINRVSCDHAGYNCVIVGGVAGDSQYNPYIYVTHDAGYKWTSIKSLNQLDTTFGSVLTSVSCNNSGFYCLAVGHAITRNSFWSRHYSSKPVVYTTVDGGGHWSDGLVLPTDINDNNASALTDIACSESGQQCVAIGHTIDYKAQTFQYYSFTTSNGGMSWDKKSVIFSDYMDSFYLDSLDCDGTANYCTAVGWYKLPTASNVYKPLIYSTVDAGKNWVKDSQFNFRPLSDLKDIFCSINGDSCMAVGVQVDFGQQNMMQGQKSHRIAPPLLAVVKAGE